MDTVSLWLGSVAIIIAVLSLLFSVLSWRESNRPIVTARVTTAAGSLAGYGTGAALNLLVENTGNRPARNINLSVIEQTLRAAFDSAISDEDREDIQACFSTKFVMQLDRPRGTDIALVHGAHLASILTAVSGIETYLRSEAREDGKPLVQLIDSAAIDPALRADLHRLRKYRNRWVHVDAPWDDARVLSEPEHFENELEEMALFGARVLRRAIYSDQLV